MYDMLNIWRYFAQVTLDGSVYNKYLYLIPDDLYDSAAKLGKFIAELLFG